jgi:hypothetical protein
MVKRGIRHTQPSSHRLELSEAVLGSAALPAVLRDPCFSTARNQGGKKDNISTTCSP